MEGSKESFEKQMQLISELTGDEMDSIMDEVQNFARIQGVSLNEAANFYRSCSRLAVAAKK